MFKLFRSALLFKRCYATCFPMNPCDPGTNITILHNGIRIATEYRPSPVSCMSLFIEAGPRFETSYNNGISHFLEHMAYQGFCEMSKCEFEASLWQIGAKITSNTSRDIQSFTGLFLSQHTSTMIDNFASIVTNMRLDNCDIEREKYNVCLEMIDEENDPRAVTFDYLHQTAFQGTSLAQRVIGPSKNINKFDGEFAVNFFCQQYQPYKLSLCTSGQVNHEDIVAWTNARLGHLQGDPSCESDEGQSRFTGSQVIYRDDSMPFAHVAIAFEAPGFISPEYYRYLVASQVIGKWHRSQGGKLGNAAYLARAASCDESCECFESFYITYRDIGLWGVYFVAKKMDVENMVENIQREWMNLCITLQDSDLKRAINIAKLKVAQNMNGLVNSCMNIGTEMMYTCTRKSLEEKMSALSSVEVSMVRACAENMLYDKCPAVAAVGPTEGLPDYTRIRSGQYWLRL